MPSAPPGPLVANLRAVLGASNLFVDEVTLRTYSTDASPCFLVPQAVARVSSESDVVETLRICAAHGVPVTPRAAGTSLSGAAIGAGVVLDTTHLAAIREFNPAEGWVRVEPGVQLRDLNAFLREKGFRFPLEPGSLDWCRIGGMLGHNASGYQSVKYGQTADYVLALRVVLADGTVFEARDVPLDGPEWGSLLARVPALEAVRQTISSHSDAILRHRRPVKKHACGYDLAYLAEALGRGAFPLARLFVGAEGTLGVVTEATLRVLPLPTRTVTLLLFLDRFEELGPLVEDLLPLRPSALEGIDGDSLDVLGRGAHGIPPQARAMILVEFDDEDFESRIDRISREIVPRYALSRPMEIASSLERQTALWSARRSLFPTLLRQPGRRRPWGFVEDSIVPTSRVPEFITFLVSLTRKHGTVAGIYGHLGDGNIHYRPLFDPTDPEDFERMRAMREEFDDAVLDRFQGAPSAEHGIGRIRGEALSRTWGPEVVGVMRSIKETLDPRALLNPGVLLASTSWWEAWGGLESREAQ